MEDNDRSEHTYYLDTRNGRIVPLPLSVITAFEENKLEFLAPWEAELLPVIEEIENESEQYEEVPAVTNTEIYNLMLEFAKSQTNDDFREKLLVALNGKGSFRRFDFLLRSYPQERHRWFRIKDLFLKEQAVEWLNSIGIIIKKDEIGKSFQPPLEVVMRKRQPKENDKVYVFNIGLFGGAFKKDNNCWRKIAILGRHNLYNFAEAIVKSFHFYLDHCFGFYSDLHEKYHDSKKQYELFADLPDLEPTPAGSVKKTKVSAVFKEPGEKMMFLFDYGDGWRFIVELLEIKDPDLNSFYPILIEQFGRAPEQYPVHEEDIID